MSLLGRVAKHIAVLVTARAGTDYLMDRDEGGTTRLGRWLGGNAGPVGVNALEAGSVCAVCRRGRITAGANTCAEHNVVVSNAHALAADLALTRAEPVYVRREHQRNYAGLIAAIREKLGAPLVRAGHCPTVTTNPAPPPPMSPVPVTVALVTDLQRGAVTFYDVGHALDQGIITGVRIIGARPVTESTDPRLRRVHRR